MGSSTRKAKLAGVNNVDMMTTMESRLAAMIKKKMGSLNLAPSQPRTQKIIYYDFCSKEHSNDECPSIGTIVEQAYLFEGNRHGSNPY